MIDTANRERGDGPSADATDIRRVFVNRVHEVLQEGYARIDAASHQTSPEPAITGELVRSMKSFLSDMAAPEWADHFSVHDDPPVNDDIHFGRDRNRIDIRVDSAKPRPGTSFAFEAKRLARGYPVSKYLGKDGLGCILCGDYARDEDEAGMIGYMQDDDAGYWAVQIESTLRADQTMHELSGTDWWQLHDFPHGPSHVFASFHARSAVGRSVVIYHSLLLFHANQA